MHGLAHPFHTPYLVSLQFPEWREVVLKKSWSVGSFKPHQCDQYLHLKKANVDVHTPLIPLHQTFTPYLAKRFWETEESHLSDTEPAVDNLHFVLSLTLFQSLFF